MLAKPLAEGTFALTINGEEALSSLFTIIYLWIKSRVEEVVKMKL